MRSSTVFSFCVFAGLALGQQTFSLGTIVVPKPVPGQTAFIDINTSGPALDSSVLNDAGNWTIVASAEGEPATVLQGLAPQFVTETAKVHVVFDLAQLGGRDPRIFGWSVLFKGVVPNLTASKGKVKSPDTLGAAKGKQDASYYLFGSYLAGVSTKPIYVIDAKLNVMTEITKGPRDAVTGKKAGTGWFWGIKSALSSNTSATLPSDRSRADPDAVEGALAFGRVWQPCKKGGDDQGGGGRRCSLPTIDVDIRPIGGEFSRKYPASNLLTKGYATFVLRPQQLLVKPQVWAALYPSVGYEVGLNMNQPSTLFKQPVDLSGWGGIRRAVFITKGEIYAFQAKLTADELYRFAIDIAYQPRVPFSDEPFVTTEYVDGKRVSVTRLRRNTRHEVEAGINWNFSKFLGFRAQYRYGALPPLFEFVDHQVTFGFTFKAK